MFIRFVSIINNVLRIHKKLWKFNKTSFSESTCRKIAKRPIFLSFTKSSRMFWVFIEEYKFQRRLNFLNFTFTKQQYGIFPEFQYSNNLKIIFHSPLNTLRKVYLCHVLDGLVECWNFLTCVSTSYLQLSCWSKGKVEDLFFSWVTKSLALILSCSPTQRV